MSLRRTDLKTRIALLTAVGVLAAAPTAAAEEETEVVPPDNSAVNQYTETYPTGGGERDVHKGRRQEATPKQVLGDDNAKKLEKHGSEGRAVAEVAAETAPAGDGSSSEPADEGSDTGAAPATGGGGNGDSGGGSGEGAVRAPAERQDTAPAPPPADPKVDVPAGSSGISEVLAQATGSTSDGELGPLLPLAILAAIGWAIVLLLRRRPDRAAQ